jgi:flagellar motor switch protein FliN
MSTGIDANDGGMLTQETLDAMLAEMGPEEGEASFGDSATASEPVATQASRLVEESAAAHSQSAAGSPSLSFVSFNDVAASAAEEGTTGFDRVQDISLEISVELGRTRLLIKDILQLTSGSIIELEKIAGEPVDLLANGLLIARGEVVVVEDSFGVRITQVITAAGRKEIANGALHRSLP